MILIIDNYDGCANNIYQLAGRFDPDIRILRHDAVTADGVAAMVPDHIILSGGSGDPRRAGQANAIVRACAGKIPILGICQGMRIIGAEYGIMPVKMAEIRQGKAEMVHVTEPGLLFQGVPDDFRAAFYQSETITAEAAKAVFRVTAVVGSEAAAIEHPSLPLFGVMFHPESFLSSCGDQIMENFLKTRA